jgi:hypothetical protein
MKDITNIFEALIGLAVAFITAFLIPYIRSRMSEARLDKLRTAAEIAVMAAEEAARSGLIPKLDKYEYAVKYLEDCGYTVRSDELKKVIDATVWELINHLKEG